MAIADTVTVFMKRGISTDPIEKLTEELISM